MSILGIKLSWLLSRFEGEMVLSAIE